MNIPAHCLRCSGQKKPAKFYRPIQPFPPDFPDSLRYTDPLLTFIMCSDCAGTEKARRWFKEVT